MPQSEVSLAQHLSLVDEMEEKFFGFGHWSAPYWFIGPEQGKGPREVTGNALRAEAWKSLGGPETCDCFEFQRQIADLTFHTGKVPLQSTWKSLILLLLTLQGEAVDDSARKRYQRDRWGREEGETCIIELSGSASQKLREAEHRARHLSSRVEHIRSMVSRHEPKLVLMYGASETVSWAKIANRPLALDDPISLGKTTFASVPHPQTFGRRREDWIHLGLRLRRMMTNLS